jgi:beta-mannosidase
MNHVNNIHEKRNLDWKVGYSLSISEYPDKFHEAQVPGAVQLDWAKGEHLGDYIYADNFKKFTWMEDVYWFYSTNIEIDPSILNFQKRLFFVCKGIDYDFKVYINGNKIFEQEGMFSPFEIDLTDMVLASDFIFEGTLEVIVSPAPKSVQEPADRRQADQCVKPAVSYGWDFHPRLIPLGIWRETFLEIRSPLYLSGAYEFQNHQINYHIDEDYTSVSIRTSITMVSSSGEIPENCKLRYCIEDNQGIVVFEKNELLSNIPSEKKDSQSILRKVITGILEDPRLWWPHDQGDPYLYTSRIQIYDCIGSIFDESVKKIGFREVKLVMNEGAWEVGTFPKPRADAPITLQINGRKIFGKGSNWVCPHIFPGALHPEDYRKQLELAKEANMNLLRCWAGSIIPHEWFHQICDELGIMVWQEFPLSCNDYKGTQKYLKVLDCESKSIIATLKNHPSLVIWCGGNELFNSWSGMTDQSAAIRLLNKNCYDMTPEIPFMMTSPLIGMGHGHYIFRDEKGMETFQFFRNAKCTAYTEFGCTSPASVEILKTFIPEEELFPPKKETAWESHHSFGVWAPNSHLTEDIIEFYFGKCENLEDLVENGQKLQGVGLTTLFEEVRRQKPHASMALSWCFNEPWPAAANSSMISWPCKPKKAFYNVKKSLRPILASARIAKFSWIDGEIFEVDLFLLNDSPEIIMEDTMEVHLEIGDKDICILKWNFPVAPANTNIIGPTGRIILPNVDKVNFMVLKISCHEHPEWDSQYYVRYDSRKVQIDDTASTLNL